MEHQTRFLSVPTSVLIQEEERINYMTSLQEIEGIVKNNLVGPIDPNTNNSYVLGVKTLASAFFDWHKSKCKKCKFKIPAGGHDVDEFYRE